MTDEQKALREAVKKAMFTEIADVDDAIDAAIAVALERAAEVAKSHHKGGCNCLYCYGREDAEAAIRALISASGDATS